MDTLFSFLFLGAASGLIWSLVAPRHLLKTFRVKHAATRKQLGWSFGIPALAFFVLVGITAPSQPKTTNLNIAPSSDTQTKTDQVTSKQVTETQPIAFTTTKQNDSSLPKGQAKTLQTGKDGSQTLVYNVTYTNGQETSRTLVSKTTTAKPIDEIIAIGTYATPTCSNGSYVNSDGLTVCSPESSPSAPAGATAQCNDGTYSFSLHHSGTCSHHGGVAVWL